ncbi:helix-turn-helix domain-containing protein [Chelativorans xinjiangense]|uniref:helix-turn-helix domain-containing protein n=1 Tax=Chelativorans xinjiangense TaxID=2681485 RepID=UPI0013568A0A|nr:helix-turn-helix domain-containing protein [Chelativorans xinjiangense]
MSEPQCTTNDAQYTTNPTRTQAQLHAQYKAAQERMRAAARRHREPPPPPAPEPVIVPESQVVIALRREIDVMAAKIRELEWIVAGKPKVHVSAKWHSYQSIERRICRVFGMNRAELLANRRDKRTVLARQAVMYWTCRLTKRSLPEIGRLIGGRDHTTCLSGKNAYPKKRAAMGRFLRAVR